MSFLSSDLKYAPFKTLLGCPVLGPLNADFYLLLQLELSSRKVSVVYWLFLWAADHMTLSSNHLLKSFGLISCKKWAKNGTT